MNKPTENVSCRTCYGSKVVTIREDSDPQNIPCPRCHGKGAETA